MSVIREQRINDWAEFDDIVKGRSHRGWVYRGHWDASWKLESSLYRAFEEISLIAHLTVGHPKVVDRKGHERLSIEKFMTNAHLYLPHAPKDEDVLSWLSIMQHYGAPTRMLDFTFSPYVAAYFALETGTCDAAIYSLKHSVLGEIDAKHYKNLDQMCKNLLFVKDEQFLYVYEPRFTNQRQMAQQGVFVIPSRVDISLEEIIDLYDLGKKEMIKYIIPKELRGNGLRKLQKMNITASILFPGLEGFCRSFRHQALFPLNKQRRIGEL